MLFFRRRAAGFPAPAYMPQGTLLAPPGRDPPRLRTAKGSKSVCCEHCCRCSVASRWLCACSVRWTTCPIHRDAGLIIEDTTMPQACFKQRRRIWDSQRGRSPVARTIAKLGRSGASQIASDRRRDNAITSKLSQATSCLSAWLNWMCSIPG